MTTICRVPEKEPTEKDSTQDVWSLDTRSMSRSGASPTSDASKPLRTVSLNAVSLVPSELGVNSPRVRYSRSPSLAATGSTLSSIRNWSSSEGSYSLIRATTVAFACSGSDQSALETVSTKSSM